VRHDDRDGRAKTIDEIGEVRQAGLRSDDLHDGYTRLPLRRLALSGGQEMRDKCASERR
jgi:hypothetical protein